MNLKARLQEISTPLPDRQQARDVILWWERRRLAYNAMVAAFGFLFTALGFLAITVVVMVRQENWGMLPSALAGATLSSGLDLFILLIVVICSNVWYTGGWIAELLLRLAVRDRFIRFGVVAFWMGTAFSFLFTALWLMWPMAGFMS